MFILTRCPHKMCAVSQVHFLASLLKWLPFVEGIIGRGWGYDKSSAVIVSHVFCVEFHVSHWLVGSPLRESAWRKQSLCFSSFLTVVSRKHVDILLLFNLNHCVVFPVLTVLHLSSFFYYVSETNHTYIPESGNETFKNVFKYPVTWWPPGASQSIKIYSLIFFV